MIGFNHLGNLGQLGNQMFQYASLKGIAGKHGYQYCIPKNSVVTDALGNKLRTELFDVFNLNVNIQKIETDQYLQEPSFNYSENFVNSCPDNVSLWGFFQSEKYFKHNRNAIIELFEPLKQIDDFLERKYSDLIKNKKAVSVHIRRGDYLQLQQYHVIIGKEYYEEAKKQFDKDSVFVYFSDDINWCKDTFKGDNSIFIEKQDDILDMYLMSKITNNIIANSSFSWWAAWLNKNEDKQVICPSSWFGPENRHLDVAKKDLIPKEWKVI